MFTLVDYYADWCGPCQAMRPTLEKFETEYKDKIEIKRVDVDKNEQLAMQAGIMGIPAFVISRDGKEVARKSGAMPYEVFKVWADSVFKVT